MTGTGSGQRGTSDSRARSLKTTRMRLYYPRKFETTCCVRCRLPLRRGAVAAPVRRAGWRDALYVVVVALGWALLFGGFEWISRVIVP
jgi:hypothetical protein